MLLILIAALVLLSRHHFRKTPLLTSSTTGFLKYQPVLHFPTSFSPASIFTSHCLLPSQFWKHWTTLSSFPCIYLDTASFLNNTVSQNIRSWQFSHKPTAGHILFPLDPGPVSSEPQLHTSSWTSPNSSELLKTKLVFTQF